MRILYFLLKIYLQYAFRIFFPVIRLVNAPKRYFGRTIYVSNHASSFFDPIVIGVLQRPIVFFMTRSDVFKPAIRPITWATHMLPIYREQDNEDTKGKNEEVFRKCNRILGGGRNLLVFGEGFTDDIFVRRLKPVKKGAARIGFGALEASGWKKKIYMAAVGVNYGDPNYFGSELVISNSDRFCLNDYEEMYRENPAKAIIEVTRRVEKLMQEQLTHVANKDWVFFHEQICRLRRNGMNPVDSDRSIPLLKRWENSRKLARWMNEQKPEENEALVKLKADTDSYFTLLKRMRLEEKYVSWLSEKGKLETGKDFLALTLAALFVPFGLIHFWFPYTVVKRFTEKSFKRRVFWSSVKVMMGALLMALWNIPLVYLLNAWLIYNGPLSLCYFLMLPFIGLITYYWFRRLKDYRTKKALQKTDLASVVKKRSELLERIDTLVPRP
ncbi:MAG: 1-acyl-sn-glycerol-3-phosphate acyltransferase [Bacteroidota bacterium]